MGRAIAAHRQSHCGVADVIAVGNATRSAGEGNRVFRSAIPLLMLTLAACSNHEPDAPPSGQAAEDHQIACALAGSAQFTTGCRLERAVFDGKPYLVVRHPDGAFRRFAVDADGQGLTVADGAVEAGVAPNGPLLDVRVGEDRYRLPYPLVKR